MCQTNFSFANFKILTISLLFFTLFAGHCCQQNKGTQLFFFSFAPEQIIVRRQLFKRQLSARDVMMSRLIKTSE